MLTVTGKSNSSRGAASVHQCQLYHRSIVKLRIILEGSRLRFLIAVQTPQSLVIKIVMSNGLGETNDHGIHFNNDESDNLSDWQYLTATFDNEQMFTSDLESTSASRLSLDRPYSDNTAAQGGTQVVTSKRGRSNSTINDVRHNENHMSLGEVMNPFNSALFLGEIQRDHPESNCTIPSKKYAKPSSFSQNVHGHLESTDLPVKSWSHPQLCSQTLPQYLGRWQQDIPLSDFTSNPLEFTRFASQSIAFSERPERSPFLLEPVDDNEANHYLKFHEPLGAKQLPYVPLNKTHENPNEYLRSPNFSVEIPGLNAQQAKNASSENLAVVTNEVVSNAENAFKGTDVSLEQSKPRTIETMSNARERTGVDEITGTYNQGNSANVLAPLETAHMDEQMRLWMNMVGTPSSIPPFQLIGDKKLLLHPLTPYNYYYRDERDNIVSHISGENDPLPPSVSDFTLARMQALLHQHWFIDPVKKKRKHRKSHGKMNFQQLSKVIAQRWHQLPIHGRDFYRSVSQYDDLYYHQQLDIIKQRSDP